MPPFENRRDGLVTSFGRELPSVGSFLSMTNRICFSLVTIRWSLFALKVPRSPRGACAGTYPQGAFW